MADLRDAQALESGGLEPSTEDQRMFAHGAVQPSIDQTTTTYNNTTFGADGVGAGIQSEDSVALHSRARSYSHTLNNAPSKQFSTTSLSTSGKKRASRQMLESQLPKVMRQNLPEYDANKVYSSKSGKIGKGTGPLNMTSPPPPPPPLQEGLVHDEEQGFHSQNPTSASAYHNYFAYWWHSSNEQNHETMIKRKLQRRLTFKNVIITAVAEFVGTFFFLFFALAINTTCSMVKAADMSANPNSPTNLIALLVSSLGFGFSLAISAWVFFRVSGGVQNPAITLALTLTGALNWLQCAVLTVVQFAGGIASAALVSGLYPETIDSGTRLGPSTTINQGFWLEFFMSIQLIFTVLMLAAEKHRATFLAPVGIGLALFITQLLGQPYTGASVNPARTLGPDTASGSFPGYTWIYYIAPYAAAIVTSVFYHMLKWIRYETATPDQDADEHAAGQMRQVLIDADGNVIGRLDTLKLDAYNAHHGPDAADSTTQTATPKDEKPAGSLHNQNSQFLKRANSALSAGMSDDQQQPVPASHVVPSQPALHDIHSPARRHGSVSSATAGLPSPYVRYHSAASNVQPPAIQQANARSYNGNTLRRPSESSIKGPPYPIY